MATRLLGHTSAVPGELFRQMAVRAGESGSQGIGDAVGGLAVSRNVERPSVVREETGPATCRPSQSKGEGRRVAVPEIGTATSGTPHVHAVVATILRCPTIKLPSAHTPPNARPIEPA